MAQPIRVLLLIPHLGGGGAEQVTLLLARDLAPDRYELHLGLIVQTAAAAQRDAAARGVPPRVTVHGLGASRVRKGAVALLRLVHRIRPAVILSGMAHLNFLVLLLRPFFPAGTQVLVRQNATASAALAAGGLPRSTRLLYKWLYPRADCVICPTCAMADDLAGIVKLASHQIAVLANPIDLAAIRAAARGPILWTGSGPHLLAVGRLAREKGFDCLLDAFAQIRRQYPQADLLIAGEGRDRGFLEHLTHVLGLQSAVRFVGQLSQPYGFFPGATLLVLSSRHEGMPNALLEAAAAGLPIVSTPSSGGVVAMLQGQPDAWLAKDNSAAALAEALRTALSDLQSRRNSLQNSAPYGSMLAESYSRSALRAYEELIDAASAAAHPARSQLRTA